MGLYAELKPAGKVDRDVRARLAHSLGYIFEQAQNHLEIDAGAVETAAEKIRLQRQHPGVFARYYELVPLVMSSQFAEANRILAQITELAHQPVGFKIQPYDAELLGEDYQRFPRLLFSEDNRANPMSVPSGAVFANSEAKLNEAFEMIDAVDPQIHAEITGLLSRIWVTGSSAAIGERGFSGVTSFMVWGGSFVNGDVHSTTVNFVQYLVHEITHSLLFGLNFYEPLVLNAPDEAYASPLRLQPRPMDGIFHATIVCARIVDFNEKLLDTRLLAEDERGDVERAVNIVRERFQDGSQIIEENGKLSDMGSHLLNNARERLAVA